MIRLSGEGQPGWKPLIVTFGDEQRERQVVGVCEVCNRIKPVDQIHVHLVSPTGLLHHAEGDRTSCGKDATGPEWWWRA